MSKPEKRIRLDSDEAVALEEPTLETPQAILNRLVEVANDAKANSEKKLTRKTGLVKPVPIRPMILEEPSDTNLTFTYSVKSETLVNLIFGRSDVPYHDKAERHSAPVYQFSNGRKLTFFPITFNTPNSAYTCVECFQVYAVMTACRSRLDNLYTCRLDELNEKANPLRFPHYCAHWETMSSGQRLYFAEYAWHFKTREIGESLIDNAFAIGRFVKNLCSMDEKLKKFCVDNEGTDLEVLMDYVKKLDYTVASPMYAKSFFNAFNTLHKDEIQYKNGLLYFHPLLHSQDSGLSESPPLSGSPSVRVVKRPAQILSPLQPANGIVGQKSKRPLRIIKPPAADLPRLQTLENRNQRKPVEGELDVRKFITGLLLNAINTVKNEELQLLFDGLRPLVAKYAPNQLSQFITMIHNIDRQMPNHLRNVVLNTQLVARTVPSDLRPVAFRLHKPKPNAGGTSANPIIVPDDPASEKTRLLSSLVQRQRKP